MKPEETVNAMKQAAIKAASNTDVSMDTIAARAAYARGVRAMAALVHSCIKVADDMADQNKDNHIAFNMLKGYASSLTLIVDVAEDLIPPGYEV